jgi:hypothetical protein
LEHSAAIIDALAHAIVEGDPVDEFLRPVAERYRTVIATRYRDLVRRLRADEELRRVLAEHREELALTRQLLAPIRMRPGRWKVPAILTPGDLADWLALTPGELDWFADLKELATRPKLCHYRYRLLDKGNGAMRVIESPKPRLKWIQQRILSGILDIVTPHPAAHGFVKRRSVKTFAATHVSQRVVLRMDLRDFFPSIGGARVQTVFRTLGYPEAVADLLGGIATNAVPRAVVRDPLYNRPHLPQGAPTSPSLANMCLYRADCRLTGLAESAGAQYTRYADDLAFSGGGDFERCAERFSTHAAAILHEEGFAVHHRKTRIMRQGVRQHLAGVVVNRRLNIWRDDFDRLKATLTNCVRHGAATQNRDERIDFRAHLEGRVSYVESINLEKGRRLRAIFERIVWT